MQEQKETKNAWVGQVIRSGKLLQRVLDEIIHGKPQEKEKESRCCLTRQEKISKHDSKRAQDRNQWRLTVKSLLNSSKHKEKISIKLLLLFTKLHTK